MRLCIDIGNSKTKWAVYDPVESDRSRWVLRPESGKMSHADLKGVLGEFDVESAILSATRDYDPAFRRSLDQMDLFIALDHNTPLPVQNHYRTPETLGRDRLAAVCGAQALYPDENVLVVDAGTCITIDLVDDKGNYHGGSIHPGISMRYKALNNYTGKLPFVKRQETVSLSGSSTKDAIASGVQYAVIREIDGMIEDYSVKKGELKVIITGGDAPFFVSRLKSKIFAHSNLVLAGLREILDYNAERLS